MDNNVSTSDISDITQKLLKIKLLKESQIQLQKIAEGVLEHSYPFSVEVRVKITIPPKEGEENTKKSAKDILDMLTDTDSEKDFMAKLENVTSPAPKEIKEISVNLSNLSDAAFLSMLERAVIDTKQEIKSKLKQIKL
jgi:hypothetical protein